MLRQTRGIRSFNEVTDADLVRTICDEVGVKAGQVDATNVTHPYIAQFNETNWDFIQRRAVASDCIVYVDDGALSSASHRRLPMHRRSAIAGVANHCSCRSVAT